MFHKKFLILLLSSNLVLMGVTEEAFAEPEIDEVILEHDEKILQGFRVSGEDSGEKKDEYKTELFDFKLNSEEGMIDATDDSEKKLSDETLGSKNKNMDENIDKNDDSLIVKLQEESKAISSESLSDFDENISEMSLSTLNLLSEDGEDDDAMVFSNIKDSAMNVFNEDVLEEELSQADIRPSHTPWTLVGVGVGAGVVVVVLVGVVVAAVMIEKKKNVTVVGVV